MATFSASSTATSEARMSAELFHRFADVQSGESVNCNIPGEPTNDIHVAIGQALDAPECTSITAEIIPHFRPHAWTMLATFNGTFDKARASTAR
jgi:hypothetical protein